MLFHVQWTFVDNGEDGYRRRLQLFQGWEPPAAADFKGFYSLADGSGGVAIVEVDSVATLARTMTSFAPHMTFTADPILPVDEGAAIGAEGIAFRDAIS